MLGCKYEERHNPNLGDLSYITDYSSSRQDVSTPLPAPPPPPPLLPPLLLLFLLVRLVRGLI